MADRSAGDDAQIRIVTEQIAEAVITKFVSQHPELKQASVTAEIPAPLKWAAIVASAVITMSASAGLVWLVSSVSGMSVTLARMDERMGGYIAAQESRMTSLERRTAELETYHRQGDPR